MTKGKFSIKIKQDGSRLTVTFIPITENDKSKKVYPLHPTRERVFKDASEDKLI